ncbi:MAG TPA: c-type cytochrome biogenesis protein CcmI [Hellea balneolensis]|uniref:C-type cytochrome biogenesis protein CcmI n=1 Tax=Hellea balneolensis TaxID=287478 RepID=A0A7C5R7S3_9PROT|nr:c-type cytochrome biogenesis protein CcmI [Hellea balneolensis]
MIWLVVTALVLAGTFWLVTPLLAPRSGTIEIEREIADYRAQIRDIEARLKDGQDDESKLRAAKTELERQVLKTVRAQKRAAGNLSKIWPMGVVICMVAGSLGLYHFLGAPQLARPGPEITERPQVQTPHDGSIDDLVAQLKTRLAAMPDTAPEKIDGQRILARTLLRMRRYDEAARAFDKLRELAPDDPNINAEVIDAKAYIRSQNMGMSQDERMAMISGMVENLAGKLEENPDNPALWARLLRSRNVLGQTEQLAKDVERVKSFYQDDPETFAGILKQAGLE